MTIGVLTLNFGEPRTPEPEIVLRYLERIFLANAELEAEASEEEARRRSRELAERRLDGLLEEYREIGGSPLNEQAAAQTEALGDELRSRGLDAETYMGMQFTPPFIEEAVDEARRDGVDLVVGLPVYPLCGRSTTIAALDSLDDSLEESGWDVATSYVSGWHRHPEYLDLRARAIQRLCSEEGLDLHDPDVRLVFSAHGTPLKYLDGANRYDEYVREYCVEVTERLGGSPWELGFQNHGNRRIEWTEPEVDEVVEGIDATAIVVDAMSFMHEQSETLSELDVELREVADEAELEFHRVPVPHDDPDFVDVLADLVEIALDRSGLGMTRVGADLPVRGCRCRPAEGTVCLNVDRP